MDQTHEVLKQIFGFDRFRPNQEAIVSALLEKRDILQVPVSNVRKKKSKTNTVRETLALAKQGMTLKQIASRRNLSPGTISQRIEKLLGEGERLDVDQFIDSAKRIEIERLFSQLNADTLKPLIEETDGAVTYAEARLVRAFMQ